MLKLPSLPEELTILKWVDRADRVVTALRRREAGRRDASRNLGDFYDQVWRRAARQVGAKIEARGCGVFEISRGGVRTRVQGNISPIDDLATHCIVRTKPVIYRILEGEGLPVPRHLHFGLDDIDRAFAFVREIDGDCVVKPASDSGGGAGVTTGVRSRWQLARAAFAAARRGADILVEEQIPGDNYRLLFLDGELLDAIVRRPPTVQGDGKSTIEMLVRKSNEARVLQSRGRAHCLLTVDLDMKRTLEKQGWSLRSVPAFGETVVLKTVINENSELDNHTATSELCPELIEEAARAARSTGVRLAGVDIITTNPRRSLRKSGGVVLEVNSPPGFYWHYHKRDGSFPLATHVLEKLLTPEAAHAKAV